MKNNKALLRIQILFICLFLLLMGNLLYYVLVSSYNVIINSYNPRLNDIEEEIIRGKIMDRNGVVLAETLDDNGKLERIYPYEKAFAHIVGYSHVGKTGIESLADINLLQSNVSFINKGISDIGNKRLRGDNIITTLDLDLQLKAYELLGDNKGAIVALEPSTGKILAMVSKPDFDPNYVEMNWDELKNDEENSPFLNRATQGLYPPGSTFKIITALEYIREFPNEDFTYTCYGQDIINGKIIHCYNNIAHNQVNLEKAFAVSCNTTFANIGKVINIDKLNDLSNELLFNTNLPYSLPSSKSSFNLNGSSTSAEVSETVIGQGKTLITPLHNAMISAMIANGGIMMKPYVIDRIENNNGKIIEKNLPEVYKEMLDVESTRILTQYMNKVVEEGTGKASKSDHYKIAAKTGSAENPTGDTHAWYVGFAPSDNPKIAIAILIENAGSSSVSAVPLAKKLLDEYLEN